MHVNFFHATVKTRRRWDGRALWAHLSAKVVPSTVTSVSSAHLYFDTQHSGPTHQRPISAPWSSSDLLTFLPLATLSSGASRRRRQGQQGGRRRTHHQPVLPLFSPSTGPRYPGGLAAMADTNPDAIKRYTPPVHR